MEGTRNLLWSCLTRQERVDFFPPQQYSNRMGRWMESSPTAISELKQARAPLIIREGASEKINCTLEAKKMSKLSRTAAWKQRELVDLWGDIPNVQPVNPRKVWRAWSSPGDCAIFCWPIRANRDLNVSSWVTTVYSPAAAALYWSLSFFRERCHCLQDQQQCPSKPHCQREANHKPLL